MNVNLSLTLTYLALTYIVVCLGLGEQPGTHLLMVLRHMYVKGQPDDQCSEALISHWSELTKLITKSMTDCAKSLQGEARCGSAVYGKVDEMSPAPLPLPQPPSLLPPVPGPPLWLDPPPCGQYEWWKTRRTRKN